jgi:hypothetical protein
MRGKQKREGNIIMILQQELIKLISLKTVLIQIIGKEIEISLNFILYHLEQQTKFPRTIITKN